MINLIAKNSNKARCHSFGIGSGASRELVKGAAIAGKGTYQFIADNDKSMNEKVIYSLSQAVKPALVDFALVVLVSAMIVSLPSECALFQPEKRRGFLLELTPLAPLCSEE